MLLRSRGLFERLAGTWLPAAKFFLVGASGILVNTLAMALAVDAGGVHYLVAAALATQASTVWNFVWTDRWVFAERRGQGGTAGRFARFWSVNNAALVLRWPMLWLLTGALGIHYLVGNLITLVVVFVARYAISAGWIWQSAAGMLGRWDQLNRYGDGEPLSVPPAVDDPRSRSAGIRDVLGFRSVRWIPLALILVVAAFLRLYAIGSVGFNSDEAVYAGQGAAMVGEQPYVEFFSLFRAHPLLLQVLLGSLFRVFAVSDVLARVFVAGVFGVGAVVLTYLLAARAYSRRVALVAAALLATMPYHVIVTRQVLVDVPMAFFILLTMYLLKRGVDSGRQEWFVAAAASASLATLAKEVAVLLVIAAAVYLVWSRSLRWVHRRTMLAGAVVYLVGISPFVVSRAMFSTGSGSSLAVFIWQFGRAPNHNPDYFGRILLQYWGWGLVGLALWGLWVMVRRRENGDMLHLSVLLVFLAFFQLWPTKLFFYLVAVAPLLAVAAALGIEEMAAALGPVGTRLVRTARRSDVVVAIVLGAVAFSAMFAFVAIRPALAQIPGAGDFDIEVQSFAGGREAGLWIRDNTPEGTRFLTIGPSIGNIVRFYGYRDSFGLSVSADPTKRNPAYIPVTNPDLAIRSMDVQYLIWDAYSADRSVFYDKRLRGYVEKYQGVAVYSAYVIDGVLGQGDGTVPDGATPRIIVYNVAGGNPLGGDGSK